MTVGRTRQQRGFWEVNQIKGSSSGSFYRLCEGDTVPAEAAVCVCGGREVNQSEVSAGRLLVAFPSRCNLMQRLAGEHGTSESICNHFNRIDTLQVRLLAQISDYLIEEIRSVPVN